MDGDGHAWNADSGVETPASPHKGGAYDRRGESYDFSQIIRRKLVGTSAASHRALAMSPPPVAPAVPPPRRFVLVEDDTLLRDLLVRTLLARFPSVALEAFAEAGPALQHCLARPPDLLITDLRLPDLDGRELIRRLRARGAPTRYLVLTNNVTAVLPAELLALGVTGFVDKASSFEYAERAVERVLAGGMYFSAGVAPNPTAFPLPVAAEATPPPEVLTEREREIARLVASGLLSKEIAARLDLGVRTVEKERTRIMAKLGQRDLPGLVRWCLQHGLA